jgi:hypothetical protein
MKLWCYDDVHRWGQNLHMAAQARKWDSAVFEEERHVPKDGALFFHMHYHPQVRTLHKNLIAQFSTIAALNVVPSYHVSVLFDDRLEQLRRYAKWMPKTWVFTSPLDARFFIESAPRLPLVSHTSSGCAVSFNTRKLDTLNAMRKEVRLAFSDIGIRCFFDQRQHGYLIWQESLIRALHYRVAIVGRDRLAATVAGETVLPLPSVEQELLDYVKSFVDASGVRFGSLGVAQTDSGYVITDISATWPRVMHTHPTARFVGSGRQGSEVWQVILDELEAGKI